MAGNITVIHPKDNYQRVAKAVIFNEEIDALTLGIYTKVLCFGSKWQLNVMGLAKTLGVSADKIRASFAKLEKTGFLRRKRAQGEGGRFTGWDYELSSEPFTDIAKTPTSENTDVGKTPTSEKWPCINRDIYTEDRDYKKKKKTLFIPPTPQEVAAYVRSRGWTDPEGFAAHYIAYHTESGWKMTNGKRVQNWKLNVVSWEPNNKSRFFPRTTSPANNPLIDTDSFRQSVR